MIEVLWLNTHARARWRVKNDNGDEQIWELEVVPSPRGFDSRGISLE